MEEQSKDAETSSLYAEPPTQNSNKFVDNKGLEENLEKVNDYKSVNGETDEERIPKMTNKDMERVEELPAETGNEEVSNTSNQNCKSTINKETEAEADKFSSPKKHEEKVMKRHEDTSCNNTEIENSHEQKITDTEISDLLEDNFNQVVEPAKVSVKIPNPTIDSNNCDLESEEERNYFESEFSKNNENLAKIIKKNLFSSPKKNYEKDLNSCNNTEMDDELPNPAKDSENCDLESEGEVSDVESMSPNNDENLDSKTNKNKSSKHTTLKSQKALQEQMINIYSENQRRVRETSVTLPYHKPRMPSLAEFLNRKKASNKENVRLRPNLLKVENHILDPEVNEHEIEENPDKNYIKDDSNSLDFENDDDDLPDLNAPIEPKSSDASDLSQPKPNLLKTQNDLLLPSKKRLSLLKIPTLKNIIPQITGTPETMIDLSLSPKKSSGLDKLFDRLVKHTAKTVIPSEQEVKLHLVSKDSMEDGKETIKASEIIVKVKPLGADEKPSPFGTKKLMGIKEKLLEDISKKKQKGLEERINEYQLENEEGYEEEEEELSDEDILDDDDDPIDDGAYEDNEFLDSAAVEDDGSESEDDMEIENKNEEKTLNEKLDQMGSKLIDDEHDILSSQDIFPHCSKETPTKGSLDSSFQASVITPNQPCRKHENSESDTEVWLGSTPRRRGPSWLSQSKKYPLSSSSFEDSPRLQLECDSYVSQNTPKKLNSETEILGLCTKKLIPGDILDSEKENMDELLGLCTGNFVSNKAKNMDTVPIRPTQNMNELLDLCSGKFDELNDSSDDEEIVKQTQVKKVPKLCFDSDSEAEDLDNKAENSNNLDPQNDEESEPEELNEDVEKIYDENEREINSFQRNAKATDFFDAEAELSGSDFGSADEEDDDDEENEIYGDELSDDEKVSEEELRNQVGRVHFKALLDEDKKELRFFQNMYLEDGDLHTDGGGRTRRFRWKNAGNDSLVDDTENVSEEDILENEENQNEGWRMERFEREKWLQDQKAENRSPAKSNHLKNFKLLNRTSFGNANKTKSDVRPNEPGHSKGNDLNPAKSFLSRNTNFLRSLSEKFNRQDTGDGVGRRSTKNFVFLSTSPEKVAAVKRPAEEKIIVNKNKRQKTVNLPSMPAKQKSVFDFIE